MNETDLVKKIMEESVSAKKDFLNQAENIYRAACLITNSFKCGNKLLVFGNGGSAADSQHIAGELVGRYKLERKGLPAVALTTDTSVLTAWSNDYNFTGVFERQVEALAKKGDVLMGLSTSGNSENVYRAFKCGRDIGTLNISLTGNTGGKIRELSDININSYSGETPRIQECHVLAYHIICELVEKEMFR
ncbi:Phosphoheptose isomerase [uncultured archaeon]|nr:Phosphoheptose isomerase [uncultured archaeon]